MQQRLLSAWASIPTRAVGCIHVDAPGKLTDFSQKSGRAGRDGSRVASIVLLAAGWVPSSGKIVTPDEEAMQLYPMRKFCARAILSQFLDSPKDRPWFMVSDEPQVCRVHHDEARPVGPAYSHGDADSNGVHKAR